MKKLKIIALCLSIALCCVFLTSCSDMLPNYVHFWNELSPEGTLEYDEDDNLIYNGQKYIYTRNNNGMLTPDYESEHCVKLASLPYSYILGALSVYYGDDLENPDFIACSRGDFMWFKEGIDVHEVIMTNNNRINDKVSFRICDVITGETIPYSFEQEHGRRQWLEGIQLEAYPALIFSIIIVPIDGEFYLQYVWDSDYYRITADFEDLLYEHGLLK